MCDAMSWVFMSVKQGLVDLKFPTLMNISLHFSMPEVVFMPLRHYVFEMSIRPSVHTYLRSILVNAASQFCYELSNTSVCFLPLRHSDSSSFSLLSNLLTPNISLACSDYLQPSLQHPIRKLEEQSSDFLLRMSTTITPPRRCWNGRSVAGAS